MGEKLEFKIRNVERTMLDWGVGFLEFWKVVFRVLVKSLTAFRGSGAAEPSRVHILSEKEIFWESKGETWDVDFSDEIWFAFHIVLVSTEDVITSTV